ncbi:hypothetical protein L1987_18049 [Smallanthus sonchifolius]|uniref:Uncharacterized protein n=1 Tax=Smallanthus sonchifolius TaxID=185202 RepID=A0ACB9IZ72_9ASTR|nr:hypothetical protein L1987_18049 [Smallanthus sonchifolius]
MFIARLIKGKLISVLQPWLQQEPELELNLGFLRSHVIAKNLRFNVSALNELLDDSSSFYFTDFRIDQLSLRISNWSASAFNWEVQGFHVTVSPRVVEGRGRNLEPSDVLMEEKKKVLREIDPEGSALHGIMEKLADISPSRSQTSSLPALILNYCSLQMSDVKLLIHSSISDDAFECLWEIEEVNVDSRLVKPQSFLRGYISSFFVYSKDSYFDLEIRDLNTTLKCHDRITQLCFATDIITSLKLNDFQLIELHCSIEELGFSFSPADISTISVTMRELSRKSSPVRNGKQLWKETATRIRSLISTRRWSMRKLASVVCLWLRYIHAWQNLLSLVGYPMDIMIKRSILNMSKNLVFSESFRQQWEIISEIEKELPAPGIALARRVVRYRKVKDFVPIKNELSVRIYLGYFQSTCQLFCLIWSTICSMFNSIVHWIMLRNSFAGDPNMERIRVLPEDSCPNVCYRLNLGKISITVSPDSTTPYVDNKTVSDRKVSHLDLLSFSLIFDTLIIIYNENICENHLVFSCGSFKVMSSSAAVKVRKNSEVSDSKTILWGKPVIVFDQKGVADAGAVHTEMVSLPLLEKCMHMKENYKCQRQIALDAYLKIHGINAYLDDSELQQSQIISLKPIIIQLSTVRKDTWSLGGSFSVFSALLHGNAIGFSGVIYVDELYRLVEAVNGLMLSLSRAVTTVDSSTSINSHLLNIQETLHTGSENEMLLSTSTGKSLVILSTLYILKCTSEIQSMDLVIQKSRKIGAMENEVTISESFMNQNLSVHFLPDNGIQISVQKIHMNFSYEKKKGRMEGLADFFGLRAVIFRYANDAMQSHHICELSISNCTFNLSVTYLPNELSSSHRAGGNSTSGSNISHTMEDPISKSTCLIARISSSEFYLIGCPLKDVIVGKHQSSKLELSLSVEHGCQTTVSCHCQGGIIFLETTSAVMFSQFGNSYIRRIRHILHGRPSFQENLPAGNSANITTWGIPEDFTMDLSQFYLALFARDESGRLHELLFGADTNLNLKVVSMRKKLSFSLPQLSILSRVLQESNKHQSSDVLIPLMSSSTSSDPSFYLDPKDTQAALSKTNEIQSVATDARSSSSDSHQGSEKYILKKLSCFISAEEPVPQDPSDTLKSNQPWVGSGSISGFEVTVSLPEIQMLLSVAELSGVSSKETTASVQQMQLHNDEEPVRNFEEMVQDGSIIAIQDVHQHMYIVVEGAERKYHLGGAMHYSLAGEMALFRVKYHYQRIWKSSYLWFSLTSLYAKNESGEHLQLNCNPRSNFVELSCSGNSGSALWRSQPFKSSSFEDDSELESYNNAEKNLFYLINKKNNCSVAFVEGVLEFISGPGNPFKWKVFQDFSLARDPLLLNNSSVEESKAVAEKTLPFINVIMDKSSLTIYHELSDATEKFPLLQMSMATPEFIIQTLNTKTRVMARLVVELYSFDAQRNLWSTFLHPVEVSIFWRSRFQSHGSGAVLHKMPVHFYTRVKEFRVSMIELSLDILLFVIGKLNLAGPYAIQSSVILANCCKVENQSDLMLLCQFPDKQYATIARKLSTTMFLRNLPLDQPPEASIVSIQLAAPGDFYTLPIKFSLLKSGTFAWKTRILSKNDSKTFPGPFIIVEISWKSEDGLSIIVSPLLRIHNKTDFPVELRFQRPEQENEHASVMLKAGGTIDDSTAAFDAIKASGGSKKALRSLSVGNIIFSFRPKVSDDSMGWSDELKGGKAARLSGLFDKISYHVRKAFPVESAKSSFSTARTLSKSKEGEIDDLHFLIQSTKKDVPILQSERRASTVSLLEQKEIYILPTVQISNLLQSEIHVLLTDKDRSLPQDRENMSKHATIPCRSSANLYANPEAMFFTVTLTAFGLSCKPVNCGDWAKKLLKQKKDNRNLDMELNFGDGRYFGSLRLSCGHRGILEAAIFTPYTLKNNTDFGLFCLALHHNPLSRNEAEELCSQGYSQLGALLPPKSTISWYFRTNKVSLKLIDDKATEKALLDLDAVSGLAEINLEMEEKPGLKYITKLGVSLHSSIGKVVPSQVVSLSPRYVVLNESDEVITLRQCNLEVLEDDMEGMTTVSSKQRKALQLCNKTSKKRETSIFENFIRKHRNTQDDSLLFIQFRPNEVGLDWSGPVCVASLGRFFIKFRRSINVSESEENTQEFAVVIVSEENSSLVLRFHRPPNMNLPYRIENCLRDASITYYQKGSTELETLGSAKQVSYVWNDLSLTHKLVVQISGLHLLREVNLDKVRAWKPFYKVGQHRALGFNFPLDMKAGDKVKRTNSSQLNETQMVNLGYEVYADGLTRVLRICERNDSRKSDKVFYPGAKITVRVSRFAISLCERAQQGEESEPAVVYTPIIVMRLNNISLDSMLTDQQKLNQIRVQSMSVDQKWVGAPFAAMLRRHQSGFSDTSDSMLHVVLILLPSSSNIRQVKYSSIVLQPVDLNLDEETLMKIVPFYRKSLSDPNTPSQQYYFDHFEIHPVKIIASFLPGDSYSSYNSTQETLRTLLHSVIKVPEIKNKTVELNGVLVTHALITISELSIKCAQHYSWYVMRAIYIAKGSPLLPPAFASIFDDLASSSLDVFFDPSSGLVKLPGLTLGTFKILSKCIDGKGFSGTKRYLGDLGKTLKTAGSNILFAAVTEVSDAVLKGAETNGFNGMFNGFQQGILKLAMEPSVLGSAFTEGGPDRKIKLDRNPGIDELYIEGYLQAMLDTMYKHEYLRVRVIDDQVVLKNLPPNSVLIDEIMDHVKGFLVSKGLLTGETSSYSLRHLRVENEWRIVPTVLTLCEHLFVNFAIGWLRKQAGDLSSKIKWDNKFKFGAKKGMAPGSVAKQESKVSVWKWGVGRFLFAGIVAYIDGRLCRSIPNPVARRVVSGFVLSFLDKTDDN